jgi:hypothetical protein
MEFKPTGYVERLHQVMQEKGCNAYVAIMEIEEETKMKINSFKDKIIEQELNKD